jgi:PEP-CTERM motif
VIAIRISVFSKLSSLMAVSAVLTVGVVEPVQAQLYSGTRNSRIGTLGDLTGQKLRPQLRGLPGLNFSTLGLFGDAEVFGQFSFPRPFIFALPNFSGAGLDFNGVTFEEYLTLVANSYELSDSSDYLNRFSFQNPNSVVGNLLLNESPSLSAEFDQRLTGEIDRLRAQFGVDDLNNLPPELLPSVNLSFQSFRFNLIQELEILAPERLHKEDFVAGGGFLPLVGEPVTPINPDDIVIDDPVFTPFPTDALADPTGTDTSVEELLTDAGILTDIELNDALELIDQVSASQAAPQTAANVSVVPEPATLGLLVAGAMAVVGRRRH